MNQQWKHDGLLLVVSGSYLHPNTTYFEWWSEEYSYQDACLIVTINFCFLFKNRKCPGRVLNTTVT